MPYNIGHTSNPTIFSGATANAVVVIKDWVGDIMMFQHTISGIVDTGGAYITVEFSLDGGVTWFTPGSTFGTQPSAKATANYGFFLKPAPTYMRVTLHVTGVCVSDVYGMGQD